MFTLIILLSVFFSACSSSATISNIGSSPSGAMLTSTFTTPTIITNTSCPRPGIGRTATLPSLQLGSDQNVVYLSNSMDGGNGPSGGGLFFLKRYDVRTRATSVILNLHGNDFETAQLSHNGQWILFTSLVHGISEIQLVRIDGRYLQTLYCAPAGQQIDPTHTFGVQWSPDQQKIIFNQSANLPSPQSIYLLQLSNGKVQRELTTKVTDPQFLPRTWLDNQHVFITDISGSHVWLLDINKGPDQNYHAMQLFVGPHDFIMDFDSSYDASKFFMSSYIHQGPTNQCTIDIRAINSNALKILNCSILPVVGLRVIGRSSANLLLAVYDYGNFGNPKNGLWKINTDGTGLIQLTHITHSPLDILCRFTQYPWSNFSRNSSFYTDYNSFGSLNGGPLTLYTTNHNIRLVGWTTM